jgi:hypothetical protein
MTSIPQKGLTHIADIATQSPPKALTNTRRNCMYVKINNDYNSKKYKMIYSTQVSACRYVKRLLLCGMYFKVSMRHNPSKGHIEWVLPISRKLQE